MRQTFRSMKRANEVLTIFLTIQWIRNSHKMLLEKHSHSNNATELPLPCPKDPTSLSLTHQSKRSLSTPSTKIIRAFEDGGLSGFKRQK